MRRGSVPSWLGGKDSVFRQFQAVFRQLATTRKKRTKFVFKRYFASINFVNFVKNESYDMCNMLCNLFMIILDCII
jgi:hypothetical protein